jgi:uncharacterized phage-associated protein
MKTDAEKIVDVMLYLTEKNNKRITFVRLLKLIYFADRLHLRRHGRTISTDCYFAMEHGPVASKVYDFCKAIVGNLSNDQIQDLSFLERYFDKGSMNYEIISKVPPNSDNFSDSEIEVLDEVVSKFGNLSDNEISSMTHNFFEWKKYESELEARASSFYMRFEDFFESEDKGTVFEEDKSRLEIMRELFKEDHEQLY